MTLNVMNEYLKFNRKRLVNYSKICLEKYYDKNIFEPFLDTYFNIRYYEIPEGLNARIINKELVSCAEELAQNKKIDDIKILLQYFPYVYYFDGFLKKDVDELISKIDEFRLKVLNLDSMDSTLKDTILSDQRRIDTYLNSFDSKDFMLDIFKTNNKSLFITKLKYNIKIPKLYSDYAINNVYNRGIVLENRLFINYYMVSNLVLKDILHNNVIFYIVDFANSLFEKEDKLKRLFNIFDYNELKNRVILNISEDEFNEYKDNICDLIKNGFKFSMHLAENTKLKDDPILKIFAYTFVNNEVVV